MIVVNDDNLTRMFRAFMVDDEAWEMFVTGSAGTGKTTSLQQLLVECGERSVVVCAYTHKACDVLHEILEPLPESVRIVTLHAYLRKRPCVNELALDENELTFNTCGGKPTTPPQVLFVDEFSMVGEVDYSDILDSQNLKGSSNPKTKVVYIGDKYQLPPVGDKQMSIVGNYVYELTTVRRQASDNPLVVPIKQLIDFIGGQPATPLQSNSAFIRGQDLVKAYASSDCKDKVMLAYTNKKVQELNASIQGRSYPEQSDTVFIPAFRQLFSFMEDVSPEEVRYIDRPRQKQLIKGAKYKRLERLVGMKYIQFIRATSLVDHKCYTLAAMFGSYAHKSTLKMLGLRAAGRNKDILDRHKVTGAVYATENPHSVLVRKRSEAWGEYLAFKENVVCVDFAHAMTVHKSQGSTYEEVYLDIKDLALCAQRDYTLYLRLVYVALSRAIHSVTTN